MARLHIRFDLVQAFHKLTSAPLDKLPDAGTTQAKFGKCCQTLEGSFSAVSTFLIARVGAFFGISSIYKICILLHRSKLEKSLDNAFVALKSLGVVGGGQLEHPGGLEPAAGAEPEAVHDVRAEVRHEHLRVPLAKQKV